MWQISQKETVYHLFYHVGRGSAYDAMPHRKHLSSLEDHIQYVFYTEVLPEHRNIWHISTFNFKIQFIIARYGITTLKQPVLSEQENWWTTYQYHNKHAYLLQLAPSRNIVRSAEVWKRAWWSRSTGCDFAVLGSWQVSESIKASKLCLYEI